MIYSRWRPDVGGYDYFETSESFTINDDLPTPELPKGELGVASVEAGRPMPRGAVPVGTGTEAVGLIAPLDEARVVRRSAIGSIDGTTNWRMVALCVAGGAAMFWVGWQTRGRS